MDKVSVIIPVYNVEDYIELTMRSVMGQTYQNLEILVCDDGSTDETGKICDRLATEDPRVVIIHTANQGVSAARNTCLDIATGEYVATIDSDDLVAQDYIERMVQACNAYDADVSLCDYCKLDESAREMPARDYKSDAPANGKVYSNTECLEQMYHPTAPGMNFAAGFKVLRRCLFEDHQIRYPVGRIHEDQAITPQLIYYARRIVYLPEELYGYRIRNGSIMHRGFNKSRLDIVKATREQCDFYLQQGESKLASLAVNNHIRTEFSVLACLHEMNSEEANPWAAEILQQLRQDCGHYCAEVDIPLAKKIFYRIAAAAPLQFFVQRLRMF